MPGIKNILLDLGGVLLDIDTGKTNEAFARLGLPRFDDNYSLLKADKLFDELEKGKVSEQDFYNNIRQIAGLPLPDTEICKAWNALILEFRSGSINYLEELKSRYNLYLLSNTNVIHHTAFQKQFTIQNGGSFNERFTKTYYSHIVGYRKPEKEIYEYALQDAGIRAEETLFIDDLLKNTEAAGALGIRTHQLLPGQRIETLEL